MNRRIKPVWFWRLPSCFVLVLVLSLLPPAETVAVQGPGHDGSMPAPPLPVPDPGVSLLYPDDLEPAESCLVPGKIPFGQDVEILLGPWSGVGALRLDQPPAWKAQTPLPGTFANASDFDAVFLGKDEIAVAWRAGGRSYFGLWEASSGWREAVTDGGPTTGRPLLLALTSHNWAAFVRDLGAIKWFSGIIGNWQALPGTSGAASDPAVVSRSVGHMALFYRDTAGTVVFTEWIGGLGQAVAGGGAWLSHPIHLTQTQSMAAAPSSFASELSAISRNDDHVAVFGVDEDNRLWVREWTNWNEPDWSDTRWVKLMEDVEIARPGAASRHPNHLGVVVRDTSGVPYYIEWRRPKRIYLPLILRSYAAASRSYTVESVRALERSGSAGVSTAFVSGLGWQAPVALGTETEPFASPMTVVARSIDSLSVLGVRSDNKLYEKVWTETDGWAEAWQDLNTTNVASDQVVAAVVRHMHDFMVLGRSGGGSAWYQHYTGRDKPMVEGQVDTTFRGIPRAQALLKVDGKTVWVSVNRNSAGGTWMVGARELDSSVEGYLELSEHGDSGREEHRVSVAAADLDVDGDDEVIVATLRSSQTELDVSVLELLLPTSSPGVLITATTTYQGGQAAGEDINVALGDLDGDYRPDEVIVGYRGSEQMHVLGFEYQADTGYLVMQQVHQIPYVYQSDDHFLVQWRDMEVAIGKVDVSQGEQLVVLDAAYMVGDCWKWEACRIAVCPAYPPPPGVGVPDCEPYHLRSTVKTYQVSSSWAFSLLDQFPEHTPYSRDPDQPCDNSGYPCPEVAYSSAIGTGDLDADGLDEIAYGFGDIVATIDGDRVPPGVYLGGFPYGVQSLAVGDLDWDGRAEVVASYPSSDRTTSRTSVLEMVDDGQLRGSAAHTVNVPTTGVALVGDVDDDSHLAQLVGCASVPEVTVIAVVNGIPRWYEDDGAGGRQPIHDNEGFYARTWMTGTTSTLGATTNQGSFLTVGFEQEINVLGFKIAEFRASVTEDFMNTLGQSWSRQQSVAEGIEYSFDGASTGVVIYNSTDYTCYYYDVFDPDVPENASRAMVCHPTGGGEYQSLKTLDYWHSTEFKQRVGPWWADVGHRAPSGAHTNDLEEPGNYGTALPVDPALVRHLWGGGRLVVSADTGSPEIKWWMDQMEGGAQAETASFETNTTTSAGATVGGVSVDGGVTVGWGRDESREVSWEQTLSFGSGVEMFPDPEGERLCYEIVPFVYHARARTQAGVVYPYLEVDYYVPERWPCPASLEQGDGASPPTPR